MKHKRGRFPCRDSRDKDSGDECKTAGGNGQHMSRKLEMGRTNLLKHHGGQDMFSQEFCLGTLTQSSNGTTQFQGVARKKFPLFLQQSGPGDKNWPKQ